MEKAKLKYIEEQCNRIADGMERIYRKRTAVHI